MGCGSSKQARRDTGPAARPLRNISAPQGGLQMVPTPPRDPAGLPIRHREFDINRDDLLTAFEHMAHYLRTQNADIRIVAVGGAVNTIYLRNRAATHDVDFFGANSDAMLLRAASKYAQQQSTSQLGANWLNNSTALFIGNLQTELVEDSVEQDTVLFEEQGLTVLAAPWSYSICGKTDRMGRADERPYDCPDAASYLHEYIRLHGGPVRASTISDWAQRYRKVVSEQSLTEIDDMYREMYGRRGIDFD